MMLVNFFIIEITILNKFHILIICVLSLSDKSGPKHLFFSVYGIVFWGSLLIYDL